MKNKFMKFSSVSLTILCGMMFVNDLIVNRPGLAIIWGIGTVIWAWNIKLWWND